jgi:hypothetical protein
MLGAASWTPGTIDGTAFSLNFVFSRILSTAHSMPMAEADVEASVHALLDPNTSRHLVSARAGARRSSTPRIARRTAAFVAHKAEFSNVVIQNT